MGCEDLEGYLLKQLMVSIHAPVWGANDNGVLADCVVMFQSTHPCGVRIPFICKLSNLRVSIHAPVWGANYDCKAKETLVTVSIHAPVWGANRNAEKKMRELIGFNPRTRVGCE